MLSDLGISPVLLPELTSEGNHLGPVMEKYGVPAIEVINVCEHDTASAVVSVPSNGNFLFVSCGTWSLVGTELAAPILNQKARTYNLTNESGNQGTTRFLKNCTGLWIVQELKRNMADLGRRYTYDDIAKMAEDAESFTCLIDSDDPVFTPPGDMIARIQQYAKETNQTVPETDAELFRCAYEGLALKYKYTFLEISDSVEQEFDVVNMVGGGSQATILCQMVADASGLRVSAGPVEATAIGNIVIQLISLGAMTNVSEAREWVKNSFSMNYYYPKNTQVWDKQFTRYKNLLNRYKK